MAHYPEAIAHYPETMQIFIKKIVARVDARKNALIPILGSTGSGKSWAMESLMVGMYLYMHGKMPTVEYIMNHSVFKAKDLMAGLNDEKLQKKVVWGLDEAGVEAGHKEAMTTKNKVLGWLIQTFRNLQQIVFFTVPSISFIDASIRKMLHYYLETVSIDQKRKVCIIKPLFMQYNPRMDKIYYHNLTYNNGKGDIVEVDMMAVPKAHQEYCDAYEEKSNSFKKDLRIKIERELWRIEARDTMGPKLTALQRTIKDYLDKGIISSKDIAKEVGISQSHVSHILDDLRSKGIYIEKYAKETPFLNFLNQKNEPVNLNC